ncbi:hypothetical protein MKW98_018216 [Papaver atlanticum]|uniref:Pentatricopeptide repeat-containing protein n=1 Tax=Papaver atlanticum TaxID=357466 RepID=A0AAD4RV96_9MAGN|nr:hypothetical protein MKW98_018216 [Papaver atlanticum]
MLKAFLLKGELNKTLETYSHIMQIGLYPDNYTLPYVLKACAHLQKFQVGEQIHGGVFKLGFDGDIFVGNTLLLMYSSCARMVEARLLFEEIPERTAVSWTVLISGYSKVGNVDSARLIFDEAPFKDRGILGSMISCYVQNNCFKEGLEMFRLMQLTDIDPDDGIFVSLLSACAHLGSADIGIWIHKHLKRMQLPMTAQINTALIDMYAKCGNLGLAKNLFDGMQERDAVCWNVMISGLTMNGDAENALALFEQMEKDGFRPNDITFFAVLTACSYSGMAYKGLQIFDSMKLVYRIEPKLSIMDAKEIILRMPTSCSPSDEAMSWRALLSSCCSHGETSLAEVAAERLVQLERHCGLYVLLSNMYESSGKYDDARRVRKDMKDRGVEKTPGCSSIEVNGFIHEFVAGEKTHPRMKEIHKVLEKMNGQLE